MPALPRPLDPIRLPTAVAAALCCLAVLGCGPAAAPARPSAAAARQPESHDHDHDEKPAAGNKEDHDHDHPETLAAGVTHLQKLWGGIKTALQGGKFEEADDKVHEIGHLLEDLPDLLAATKPAAAAAETGKKAIDEVFACFETIDTALHAGEEEAKKIDLDGLTTRIEAAFTSLSSLVK